MVVICSLFPYFLCCVFFALNLSLEFVSNSSVFHLFFIISTHVPFELVSMGSLFPYFLCRVFSVLNASLVYSLHSICLSLYFICFVLFALMCHTVSMGSLFMSMTMLARKTMDEIIFLGLLPFVCHIKPKCREQ